MLKRTARAAIVGAPALSTAMAVAVPAHAATGTVRTFSAWRH